MKLTSCPAQPYLQCAALVGVLGLSACAGQQPGPSAGTRGVGTPGVSAYVPEDQAPTLQALLEQCQHTPQQASLMPAANRQNLEAACDQLQRQLHNQPGNAVPSAVVE